MLKRPPHILVTTPESLYLMLTAERSREMLRGVRTVIVDEIHASRATSAARTSRSRSSGSKRCARSGPVRIGLSATQRPIETIARLLVGGSGGRTPDGRPRCAIVDVGHRRELDLAIAVPGERARGGRVDGAVGRGPRPRSRAQVAQAPHHARLRRTRAGWPSASRTCSASGSARTASPRTTAASRKERRLRVEQRLRAGELRALVATASLELGIDIGPVELVCQIGSPRSIATFLQRVGRSGHARGAIPKGRLFPTTRDELVECAALVRAVRAGDLDRVRPPRAPLDILAQQIVAACAAEEWNEDELFELVRRAAPYAELARERLRRGARDARRGHRDRARPARRLLHRDRVNGVLRGRRGARIAALTSGGAIPETADYRVVADPDDTFVGTVNEDLAIESMAGDVFLLGSTSWRSGASRPAWCA